jgi:lysozyme
LSNVITQETLNLIKSFEGLRLEAYQDTAGVWTIGYGHTHGVTPEMKITEYGADVLLHEDLEYAKVAVAQTIKKPMTNHEFGAFVSLTHNIGVGAFRKSTAARKFNDDDKAGAAIEIMLWDKISIRADIFQSRKFH